MSGVTIVLNKDAMNALFPEGTEARLVLSSAAVKAMAEQHIKPAHVGKEVMEIITDAHSRAVTEALRSAGISTYGRHASVSGEIQKQIKVVVREEIDKTIDAAVKEAVGPAVANISARLEEMITRRTQTEVNTIVSKSMKAAIEAAMNLQPKV